MESENLVPTPPATITDTQPNDPTARFLPLDVDQIEADYEGNWSQIMHTLDPAHPFNWSWSSSQTSVLVSSAAASVVDTTHWEAEEAQVGETEEVKVQLEEGKDKGEAAALLRSRQDTPKHPEEPKGSLINFRQSRFKRKPKNVAESPEEKSEDSGFGTPRPALMETMQPAAFVLAEARTPPLTRLTSPPALSVQNLSTPAIVIEWEEFAACDPPAPQPQVVPVASGPVDQSEEEHKKRLSESDSERESNTQPGTQTSLRILPPVHYREVWPQIAEMDLTPYHRASDLASPRVRVAWWKRCCLMEDEEQEREESVKEKRRTYALQRAEFGEVHWQVLFSVYRRYLGVHEECSQFGPHWASLGCTAPDPRATFSTTGLLSLLHLLYFCSYYPNEALTLATRAQRHFPLAVTSCAMTAIAVRCLRAGTLDSWIRRGLPVQDVVSTCYVGLLLSWFMLYQKRRESQAQQLYAAVEAEAKRSPSAILGMAERAAFALSI